MTVTLGTARASTTAGTDGKWKVSLDLAKQEQGPFEMQIDAANRLTVKDVVIGEVWLCSGQSNMEFVLSNSADAQQEIANSSNRLLRQFTVKRTASATPQEECAGTWTVAAPSTSAQFTAVGYYFGKSLQQTLGAPVGLINSSFGGTPIESWMSAKALDADPDLKAGRAVLEAAIQAAPQKMKEYASSFRNWTKKYQLECPEKDPATFAAPEGATDAWKTVKLPGKLSQAGLPDAGAIWLKCEVMIPDSMAGRNFTLKTGVIFNFDAFYWNGIKIAETDCDSPGSADPRTYVIPFKQVMAEKSVIAIRVFCPAGGAAFAAPPPTLTCWNPGSTPIVLNEWKAIAESELNPLEEAKATMPTAPNSVPPPQLRPTTLFNSMIHPLAPYTLRGVTWYQGESNVERAFQYRTAFPLMIQNWRAQWGQGDLPFYFCEIASLWPAPEQPGESKLAELRESQRAALKLPNTGSVVLTDLGDSKNVHPANKKDVGERLAKVALNKTYGKPIPCAGPTLNSFKIEGDQIRLNFLNTDGGLVARSLPGIPDGELKGFAICGKDMKWTWATARIEGASVVVSAPGIDNPLAARYAWAHNPVCNLYNGSGFPAAGFRTDRNGLTTAHIKYGLSNSK
ncbi:MAG: sialate O-acetylesterase [Chthoniobacteraceae bacterium]